MKNIIIIILGIMIFALNSNLYGQRKGERGITDAAKDMITVNNRSMPISNLSIVDSISQQHVGRIRETGPSIVHSASFVMELTTGDAIDILKGLYAGMDGTELPAVLITKLNAQGMGVDEREFHLVAVKEIDFQGLNALSQEAAKAKVTIQAQEVMYNNSPANRSTGDAGRFSRMPTGNKFSLVLGGTPVEDALQIFNLKITSSSRPAYLHFNVDVPYGNTALWTDWFAANANHQTREATISVIDATGAQTLLIELLQLEIVSISTKNNPGNIARTTIGLRTNQMPAIN